jgi:3-methylfumaryl-CoA hydratase
LTIDLEHLRQWIGASQTASETIAPFPSNALAATLDRADPPYAMGSALPPLWHWLHFLPIHALAEGGPDGHAARGGFMPPVPLPRRMWAGSRLSFLKPIWIGEAVERVSTVTKVDSKQGRSGSLVFVTVRHVMTGPSGPAIEEEHDIVYRDAPAPGLAAAEPPQAPDGAVWEFPIHPDPVLLFRYSALTFNSHRIHYDRSYVTGVEGYPGLIVHGPLIATLLLEGLRRAHPDKAVADFRFRAVSPIFDTASFRVCGRLSDDGKSASLWARHERGTLAMEANATLI